MRTALVLAFLVAACGDDGPTSTPDAPTQPDAPQPDAPKSDAPALQSDGFIVLAEDADDGRDIDAVFAPDAPFGPVLATAGACTSHELPPDEGYSVGTLSITGTVQPITIMPVGTSPNVRYGDESNPADIFTPGATISISASGGDLAAFDATVTAPTTLVGYTPPTTASRANGTTLTWTAGTGTNVWLIMVGGPPLRIVLCKVPDTGSYALTAANLALVPDGAEMVSLLVGRAMETEVTTANGTMMILAIDSVSSDLALTP